ncbi:hypothetical protein EVAR_6175_1 [Eumeta japonica]|uniref:Uncharacterized protein n=1 Tax=Eumeta variegata TaxID=151549 RepID=A0A4C1TFI8_EUMVA|nr:hypothetical protein EVAR_6175_1 [Eumeta japonica]
MHGAAAAPPSGVGAQSKVYAYRVCIQSKILIVIRFSEEEKVPRSACRTRSKKNLQRHVKYPARVGPAGNDTAQYSFIGNPSPLPKVENSVGSTSNLKRIPCTISIENPISAIGDVIRYNRAGTYQRLDPLLGGDVVGHPRPVVGLMTLRVKNIHFPSLPSPERDSRP